MDGSSPSRATPMFLVQMGEMVIVGLGTHPMVLGLLRVENLEKEVEGVQVALVMEKEEKVGQRLLGSPTRRCRDFSRFFSG